MSSSSERDPPLQKIMVMLAGATLAASCMAVGPTPEQILADGFVTPDEFEAAGEQLVGCMRRLGFEAEMETDDSGTPSFVASGGVGADRAFEECHDRHISEVELVWADQNAPTPEEEAAFYNAVVSCVEGAIGEEVGDHRAGDNSALLDELFETHRQLYMRCLDEVADSDQSR